MLTGAAPAEAAQQKNWLPILECATKEVFEIMTGCQVAAVAPQQQTIKGGCTAIVGLAGALCGVVTVRCSADAAVQMAKCMLGDPSAGDAQALDALGEMCNMIAGNFKNKLAGTDERCMLSVPSVISGGEYRFHSLISENPVDVVVLFSDAPVAVCLQLKC